VAPRGAVFHGARQWAVRDLRAYLPQQPSSGVSASLCDAITDVVDGIGAVVSCSCRNAER
jgi:hypothetical protein